MAENRNEITIDNSVLVLIDHQPWAAFAVKSIDAGLLVNNLAGLAVEYLVAQTGVVAHAGQRKDQPEPSDLAHESDRWTEMPAALVAANARPSLRVPQREREAFRGR